MTSSVLAALLVGGLVVGAEETVSPAIRFELQGRARYTTVQVNVDSQGNNVIGDAANEPSIAVDPTNPQHIVIGWRQFATVTSGLREAGYAYSSDDGQSWTASTLTPGVGRSDPVLGVDSQGTFFYYSLTGPPFFPTYRCHLFRSTQGGAVWEAPVVAGGGDKPWMAVDRSGGVGDGQVYVSWRTAAGCCGDRVYARSADRGLSFSEPIALPLSPEFGTLAVGPAGELYVVGYAAGQLALLESTEARHAERRSPPFTVRNANIQIGGALASGGPNSGGLLGQVWVDVDSSGGPGQGHVYLLSSIDPPGSDPADTMVIRSSDAGATWSRPVRVNDDPPGAWQWFGMLSVAPSGRLDAVWNDSRGSAQASQTRLFYSFSTDGGATWSPNEAATPSFDSTIGGPQSSPKLGDYFHMVSDALGARLAFAATFGGEQDVYYMRIVMDGNHNGVHDGEDPTE
jgi:hypothetical protein